MDFNAAHAGFVEASYILTGVLLAGLCVWVLARDKALAKKVKNIKDKTQA